MVEVNSDSTVEDIRQELILRLFHGGSSVEAFIPPEAHFFPGSLVYDLVFIFAGRVLESGVPLGEYGIGRESTVDTFFRTRGGGYVASFKSDSRRRARIARDVARCT